MNIEISDFYYNLLNFLKENDCFDNFKNNWYNITCRMNRGCSRANNVPMIYFFSLRKEHAWEYYCNIIYDAFPWNSTPEGSNFWHKIHNKWMIYTVSSFCKDDFFSGKEN